MRRLPHQQAPERPLEAAHRRRRHPGPQPRHHLRPRHRPGRAGARRRPRLLRHARLLVPRRHRHGHEAARVRLRARAARARVRRLDRRHDHRRRDHGRAVPPRAHRRGDHRRRVAARHRHVVDGRGPGAVAPARRGLGPAAAERAHRQPAQRHLHDQGRASSWRSPACRRRSTGPRSATVIGRPELATDERFADAAADQAERRRRQRAAPRGVRRAHGRRVARAARGLLAASGPWCRTRSRPRPTRRPSPTATCRTARPRTACRSSWPPRPSQYDGQPAKPKRAPEFNEHGDAILGDLGLDWDAIVDLKVRGVVA